MGYRIAGAVLAAGVVAAITSGCSASGTATLTVTPVPTTTTATPVPTTTAATSAGTGGANAQGSAPGSVGTGGTNIQDSGPGPAGTGGTSAQATGGAPDPSTPADTGTAGATTTSAPPPAPAAECVDGQIHIRAEDISGANPNFDGTRLIFETTGNTSCWLRGFPAVTMWSPGDTVVHASTSLHSAVYGQNPDFSWNDPAQITIAPGQPAHAVVENTVTDNGRPCPISHTLNVTPPDMMASQPVETAAIHPCSVVVHPVTL
ncbi:DUF4232 domain-containing protein [Nocardia stercoris]|uniref:DUF4232 domain-containing protein n=1 Tax=Nocardia stercoris TaxID=2483361 RepID=A0A3M2L7T8_9NOCA|nr:DUF4232 domain-containing protein [Nocardia stercoris]RMI33617.1 DUF4232 domain-containing protein [Nocardia stercoris]